MSGRRRALTIVLAAIVIGVVAGGAFFMLRDSVLPPLAVEPAFQVGIVERGSLNEIVSVTAPIEARERLDLTFLLSGRVAAVDVRPGDRVRAGDILMTLDTTQLELDVIDAQIAVELQRLALAQLLDGPRSSDLLAASAAVNRAQAQLDQITRPASDEAIRIAQANLQIAESERAIAYQNYEDTFGLYGRGPQAEMAGTRVDSSELAVQIAVVELASAQQGASQGDVGAAQAALRQAQGTLGRLLEGPNEVDIALADLQIAQAELLLNNALETLEDTRLAAPFDGVVTAVNFSPGERVTPGLPVITLLDDSSFFTDVLVDELDIVRVRVGQAALIRLDAFPGAELTGRVGFVTPIAKSITGVTSFEVRINIDPTEVPIRDGLTATVDIVVSELSDVLLVPNWAIRFDRTTGRAFVNIQRADGTIEEVEIELGVRGAAESEVRAGLNEGDRVVISLERESPFSFMGGRP